MKKQLSFLFLFCLLLTGCTPSISLPKSIIFQTQKEQLERESIKNKKIIYRFFPKEKNYCLNKTKEYSYQTETNKELFTEKSEGIYNYCPSVMINNNEIHTYYCSNINSYEISDHIFYRKSYKSFDETYLYTEKIPVLTPSETGWDSVHVCDPSIISGNFQYQEENYKYLMSYLGCNTLNNQQNQIGIAVSKYPDKNWIKVQEINPIIKCNYNSNFKNQFQWGVGQASIINLKNNKILFFYTEGTYNRTDTKVELWDLSNLNNPQQIFKTNLSNNGMNDFISNADFAIKDSTLYMICDTHPFTGKLLNNISDVSTIYTTEISDFANSNNYSSCTWSKLNKISSFQKNHNAGFFRDEFGNLKEQKILYTSAFEQWDFTSSLWTYRLKIHEF